jgi:hypothetical protein
MRTKHEWTRHQGPFPTACAWPLQPQFLSVEPPSILVKVPYLTTEILPRAAAAIVLAAVSARCERSTNGRGIRGLFQQLAPGLFNRNFFPHSQRAPSILVKVPYLTTEILPRAAAAIVLAAVSAIIARGLRLASSTAISFRIASARRRIAGICPARAMIADTVRVYRHRVRWADGAVGRAAFDISKSTVPNDGNPTTVPTACAWPLQPQFLSA